MPGPSAPVAAATPLLRPVLASTHTSSSSIDHPPPLDSPDFATSGPYTPFSNTGENPIPGTPSVRSPVASRAPSRNPSTEDLRRAAILPAGVNAKGNITRSVAASRGEINDLESAAVFDEDNDEDYVVGKGGSEATSLPNEASTSDQKPSGFAARLGFSFSTKTERSSSTTKRRTSFLRQPSTNASISVTNGDILMQTLSSRAPSTIASEPSPAFLGEEAASSMAVAGIEAALQGASGLSQARPGMLPTPIAEIAFILVCSTGQFFFSSLIGNVTITQVILVDRFNMANSQAPWLNGAYLLANGLSVTLSGAIADISGARTLIIAALAWLSAWCIVGAIVGLRNPIIFLLVRAMQGLAVGALTSSSISYLGRVYKPGMRKNRVFSVMSSLAPFGFVIGGIQGGALSNRLEWIFGSNAVLAFVAFVAAAKYAPKEQTMRAFENLTTSTTITTAAPGGKRRFDYIGATLAIISCGLLIFGLTQGSSAHWSPYTYASVIAGLAMLAVFVYAESKVAQPLVPNSLWRIKGFLPLSLSYFLSFGCFTAYQFYAVQFWLRVQKVTPLTASLYLLPNAFVGVLATFLVARLFHVVPGHIILGAGAFACALGPAFFLPQRPDTPYWVLSMPGIALSTFAPDLSFAAASIFITSNVSRRYQGVAGSMLITLQNLSSAILTSLSETVAASVGDRNLPVASVSDDLVHWGINATASSISSAATTETTSLSMLHAAWWFDLAGGVVALLVAIFALRIPKAEEKEHLQ